MEEPIRFFEPTHSLHQAVSPHILNTKSMRFGARMYLLGVSSTYPYGSNPPKTPQSVARISFSCINFLISPDQNDVRSRTHNSSKRPSRRDAQYARFNIRGRAISGVKLAKKPFRRGNPSQTSSLLSLGLVT
jgi:hypothetical protein